MELSTQSKHLLAIHNYTVMFRVIIQTGEQGKVEGELQRKELE